MAHEIHLATRKGWFCLRNENGRWAVSRTAFLGDNCTMTLADHRNGASYAAIGHGHFGVKLHRSDDRGETWQEIAVPVYPEMPEGYKPKKHPAYGKPIEWSLEMIWSLEAGCAEKSRGDGPGSGGRAGGSAGGNAGGRLWCGTLPGGLFKSDDGGRSWQMCRSLWDDERREEWFGGGYPEPGIHSIVVHPDNARQITIGISCGGVWRSTDDGETWTQHIGGMRAEYMPPERAFDPNIQDPHRLVSCPAHHDRMWVQHHNGIFRSDDGGMNWTECENVRPSAFGFAVAVHPRDPDTAWFVPGIKDEKRIPVDGRFVVTRTRDGGKTFEILDNGLPQQHAYQLVFRHCLDVDATGDVLVMGTTTGSLFVSEDGGDSWQRVTADLPPIHSVRFVKA